MQFYLHFNEIFMNPYYSKNNFFIDSKILKSLNESNFYYIFYSNVDYLNKLDDFLSVFLSTKPIMLFKLVFSSNLNYKKDIRSVSSTICTNRLFYNKKLDQTSANKQIFTVFPIFISNFLTEKKRKTNKKLRGSMKTA